MIDFSKISVKKLVAKYLNLSFDNIVLLRLSGWTKVIDSPTFKNGYSNTVDPLEFDAAFCEIPTRFQAIIAIKMGNSIGHEFNVEIDVSDLENLVTENGESAFSI